jgi:hypothetical protein
LRDETVGELSCRIDFGPASQPAEQPTRRLEVKQWKRIVRQRENALSSQAKAHPVTPDGRYFVVDGRLWRTSNPRLTAEKRANLVSDLMSARRDVGAGLRGGDEQSVREARERVDQAKRELGERGPVWWLDGAPDFNRHLARNTPYAEWFAGLSVKADD